MGIDFLFCSTVESFSAQFIRFPATINMNKRVDCPSQRHQNTEKKPFLHCPSSNIHFYVYYSVILYLVIWNDAIAWSIEVEMEMGPAIPQSQFYEISHTQSTVNLKTRVCKMKENKHKKTGLLAFPGYRSLLRCRMTFVGPPQNVVFHSQMCSLSPNCKVYKLHADCMLIKQPVEWMFAFASVCFCADCSENRNCTRNIVDTNMAKLRDFIHLRFPWDKYSINCISGSQGPSQKCYRIINDAARWI